jgi:DNA-binding CsgD family transcriptional regulator
MLAEVITSDLLDGSQLESIIASFKSASAPLTPPEGGGLPESHHQLSPRELRVLVLTGHGKSLKEIASELGVSLKSVSTYRARIMAKLGLKSTGDLIAYVLRHRLK